MEKYKRLLGIRRLLLFVPVLITVGLGIYDVFFATSKMKDTPVFGFQCGAAVAIGMLSVIQIIRYAVIQGDEQKLISQYNKENDERLKAIRCKAGLPMILFTSIAMIISGIVAGYFSITIFATLIICAVCQMLFTCTVKLIYSQKM